MDENHLQAQRKQMVRTQIYQRGITDSKLLAAMEAVPRHRFVPALQQQYAYADCALPIEEGQTISQPYIVALMTDMLQLTGTQRVLDVGTGSGYHAAILSYLADTVISLEYVEELSKKAARLLSDLGLTNITCHVGDGTLGWAEAAPYDGILVAAAAPEVPEPLLEQLAEGGRLVIPIGGRGHQRLHCYQKNNQQIKKMIHEGVVFVPLRGRHGWE